jgi:hypothetical protein
MTRNVRPEIHASLGHTDTEFERSHAALAHRLCVVLIGDCLIDGKALAIEAHLILGEPDDRFPARKLAAHVSDF